MQFIDLNTQYEVIRQDIDRRIQAVLQHGRYIMGPEVSELEEQLAAQVGVRHCIGVSSGTDALLIALMALGIGPGDDVITTDFSFAATAETIVLLGANPVFVDIDPRTYNIAAEHIADAVTSRTRAILCTSLYGQCADFDSINQVAARHRLPVIEDAAQSLGATYKGRKSGGLSTIACTSFFPSKPLGCYGDGGACFTDDETLARLMGQIRLHGQDGRYNHTRIGVNGRLDTLQAAVLLAKLPYFAEELEARAQVAALYSESLDGLVKTPYIAPFNTSAYAQYTIEIENRDWLASQLRSRDIPTAVHYPATLSQQPAFAHWLSHNPVAQRAATRVLSLPFHPYLRLETVDQVANHVRSMLAAA